MTGTWGAGGLGFWGSMLGSPLVLATTIEGLYTVMHNYLTGT